MISIVSYTEKNLTDEKPAYSLTDGTKQKLKNKNKLKRKLIS